MSFILKLFLFTTDSITSKMAYLVESTPDEVRPAVDTRLCVRLQENPFYEIIQKLPQGCP